MIQDVAWPTILRAKWMELKHADLAPDQGRRCLACSDPGVELYVLANGWEFRAECQSCGVLYTLEDQEDTNDLIRAWAAQNGPNAPFLPSDNPNPDYEEIDALGATGGQQT